MLKIGSVRSSGGSHQNKRHGAREFLCPDPARVVAATRLRPDGSRHSAGHIPPEQTDACRSVIASLPMPDAAGGFAAIIPLGRKAICRVETAGSCPPDRCFQSRQTHPAGQTGIFSPDRPILRGGSGTFSPPNSHYLNIINTLAETGLAQRQKTPQNIHSQPNCQLPTPNS